MDAQQVEVLPCRTVTAHAPFCQPGTCEARCPSFLPEAGHAAHSVWQAPTSQTPERHAAFGTSHAAQTVEAQRATRRHSEAGRRNGGHVRPYQTLHRAQGALRMTLHVGAPIYPLTSPPSPARQPRLLARPQPRVRAGPSVQRTLPVLLYPAILPELSLPCLKTYSCNGSTLA